MLYVMHRKGLAAALMTAAEGVSKEAGLQSVYLHARAVDAEAQAFYSQMGYSRAGRDSKFAAFRHRTVQKMLLYKHL